MSDFVVIGITLGIIGYVIDLIMKPEKHIIGLVILAVFFSIFGAFYETTGAKSDYDRKKRG